LHLFKTTSSQNGCKCKSLADLTRAGVETAGSIRAVLYKVCCTYRKEFLLPSSNRVNTKRCLWLTGSLHCFSGQLYITKKLSWAVGHA